MWRAQFARDVQGSVYPVIKNVHYDFHVAIFLYARWSRLTIGLVMTPETSEIILSYIKGFMTKKDWICKSSTIAGIAIILTQGWEVY